MSSTASRVGVVIVSHSPKVAEGAADMVRQMVGESVKLAWAGGNPDGGLGTDVGAIMAAIEAAWSEAGVVILPDLGGAEMNSDMAIQMLDPAWQGRIVVCNAPVVEGAVLAATEAAGGSTLERVRRAEGFRDAEPAEKPEALAPAGVSDSALLVNEVGLHARPSVKLTQLAKTFTSSVEIALSADGPWHDAKSPVKVMRVKAPKGATLHVRAIGPDARAALVAVIALVNDGFGELGASAHG
jgi:dihydroxyacetone kinase phosphotransfer subunit